MNIFTYWEGPRPHYIDICLDTIRAHGGIVLTPETLNNYVDLSVLDKRYELLPKISLRCDCIRAALILQNGGMWIDADTVLLRNPSTLFDVNSQFSCIRKGNRILSGVFYAKQYSPFMAAWVSKINVRFKQGGSQYATNILTELSKQYDIDAVDAKRLIPAPFDEFSAKHHSEQQCLTDFLAANTVAVMFSHSMVHREGTSPLFYQLMHLATNPETLDA